MIKIAKSIESIVPEEFKNLPDVDYRLTKMESLRGGSGVGMGQSISGELELIDIKGTGLFGVRVNRFTTYIRTSPVVKVLDKTDNTITFQTEGGIYKLEGLEE